MWLRAHPINIHSTHHHYAHFKGEKTDAHRGHSTSQQHSQDSTPHGSALKIACLFFWGGVALCQASAVARGSFLALSKTSSLWLRLSSCVLCASSAVASHGLQSVWASAVVAWWLSCSEAHEILVPWPRIHQTRVLCIARRILNHWTTGEVPKDCILIHYIKLNLRGSGPTPPVLVGLGIPKLSGGVKGNRATKIDLIIGEEGL